MYVSLVPAGPRDQRIASDAKAMAESSSCRYGITVFSGAFPNFVGWVACLSSSSPILRIGVELGDCITLGHLLRLTRGSAVRLLFPSPSPSSGAGVGCLSLVPVGP